VGFFRPADFMPSQCITRTAVMVSLVHWDCIVVRAAAYITCIIAQLTFVIFHHGSCCSLAWLLLGTQQQQYQSSPLSSWECGSVGEHHQQLGVWEYEGKHRQQLGVCRQARQI